MGKADANGKVDYNTFIEMLTELNEFIVEKYNPDYKLFIKSIGGFSMMIYKVKGYVNSPRIGSRDIDTLTDDYPPEIVEEIKRIGEKYGAIDPDGWLNNHWNRTKKYNEEFECLIQWNELKEVSLSNICILYSDMISLLRFKIRAMDDRINRAHLNPREQDIMDVISILHACRIKDLDNIKNPIIEEDFKYFPYAVNYLIDKKIIKGTKREIPFQENEMSKIQQSKDNKNNNKKGTGNNGGNGGDSEGEVGQSQGDDAPGSDDWEGR